MLNVCYWHLVQFLSQRAVRPLLGVKADFPRNGSTDAYL